MMFAEMRTELHALIDEMCDLNVMWVLKYAKALIKEKGYS